MYLGDGARLDAVSVVDEVFRVDAKLAVEDALIQGRHSHKVLYMVLCKSRCDTGANAPDIGDGAVPPNGAPELVLVKFPYAIVHVLGGDIQRDFREKQIGAYAGCGVDARTRPHGVHKGFGEPARGLAIELKVGGRIDEALVHRIGMDVFRAHVFQVNAVDLRRDLHVMVHARFGHYVVDSGRNLKYTAAVVNAQPFHGGGDGQADGGVAAVRVRYH